VALEMVMARLLTGFPWLLLGNSQSRLLPVVQLAAVAGVPGISFLMVWVSSAIAAGALSLRGRPGQPGAWLREAALPLLALAVVAAVGGRRLLHPPAAARTLSLALIQPSVPQTVKWDPEANRREFSRVLELSRAALARKPDVLVWPEAVTPGFLRYDDDLRQAVTGLVREHRVWLILGADDAVARTDNPQEADFFNSAFLIRPDGTLAGKYDKQRLVIFGEYVPLARWLPFLKRLTPVGTGFTPGDGPVTFELADHDARLAPLICFEDVFAFHTRRYVEPDTDFLLNLTNNGWFGESAAHWQHAAMSVFRAVENGLPMVRATNNGLTCWIDSQGRLREVHFAGTDDIYRAGFKLAQITLPPPGTRQATFYRRHGDWFGWLCVAITALVLWPQLIRQRRTPSHAKN
jgi:apolipoprotein N-acyltransferase